MTDASWRVVVERRAKKDLDRLDPPVMRRIVKEIRKAATEPAQVSGIRKLKGRPESRLRVGDWRVILELDSRDRTIRVMRVLPRGKVYER